MFSQEQTTYHFLMEADTETCPQKMMEWGGGGQELKKGFQNFSQNQNRAVVAIKPHCNV